MDEHGLEVLAFDADGEMIGALVMTPNKDEMVIDASFADGYVSVGLLLVDSETMARPEGLVPNLDTAFSPELASARIEAMLALAVEADLELAPRGASACGCSLGRRWSAGSADMPGRLKMSLVLALTAGWRSRSRYSSRSRGPRPRHSPPGGRGVVAWLAGRRQTVLDASSTAGTVHRRADRRAGPSS